MPAAIHGLDRAVFNINTVARKMKWISRSGVQQAGLHVLRMSTKICPVDTGNLRGSGTTQMYDTFRGPGVVIAFTASYAIFVHEIQKAYRAPGTGWKFLEKVLKRDKKIILEIMANPIKGYLRG